MVWFIICPLALPTVWTNDPFFNELIGATDLKHLKSLNVLFQQVRARLLVLAVLCERDAQIGALLRHGALADLEQGSA